MDVQDAVSGNIHRYGWVGSREGYFALYEQPLTKLLCHPKPSLRNRAKAMLEALQGDMEYARDSDEEMNARWEAL